MLTTKRLAATGTVREATDSRRVFYPMQEEERDFPIFHGFAAYDRKHLAALAKIPGDLSGDGSCSFPHAQGSLGEDTPLQALAAGRLAQVKAVAAAFADLPSGRFPWPRIILVDVLSPFRITP